MISALEMASLMHRCLGGWIGFRLAFRLDRRTTGVMICFVYRGNMNTCTAEAVYFEIALFIRVSSKWPSLKKVSTSETSVPVIFLRELWCDYFK